MTSKLTPATGITRQLSKTHPPDVLAVFDPAAVGGGGPLRRISTQQRERTELEARQRAARLAASLPPDETLLNRLRSESKPMPFDTTAEEEPDSKEIEEEEEHVYPDGGYGWVVVGCCATLAGLTMGWGMNWGIFQTYYAERVFPGASSAYLSTAGTFSPFIGNLVCFISGRMGDRYGFKRVLYLSAAVTWIGLFSAAFATQIWHILITQGIIVGAGQGLAIPLFMSLPSQWFYKHRGLASGIAIGGAGLGGGFSTLMIRPMLDRLGTRNTLIICSFINAVITILATLLLRTRPTAPEAQGSGRGPWIDTATMRRPKFISIFVSLLIAILGYAMPYIWMPQWISVNLPDTPSFQTAIPTTLLAFSVCVGRALSGFVADKLGPMNTYILIYFFSGVVQLALWLTATSFAQICVFAVMYGLIAPGYVGLLPQIIVQVFGSANLATNVGFLLLANAPGNFISGPAGGALFDASGRTTFKWVIILGACAQFTGAMLAIYARFATERRFLTRV